MDVPSGDDLRGIFETSPAALLLCDRTVIHYANASCAALLGCPDPPAVCRLDPLTGFVAPADQPAYGGVLDRLLAGASEWEQLWVAARRADGGALHVHIRAQRVPHPAGARAFVALVDASGQLEAARRIERLALAVNLVSEAVLIAESDGAITYANRAMGALLETSAEALVGADPLTFLGDHKDLGLVTESLSGPEADRRGSVQLELLTSTGRRFPAEVSITVFREPQGGRDMGIVVVRDLTEALRVEEERAVRERQLGLMLREAHHRIKNNLQVASDLLALQAAAETPACREALGAAARRIRALAAVHEGIRADQDVTEVQAGPLIRALAQDLQTSRQGVRFEVTVDERPVTSRAASALALITAELVSNALHHGAPTAVHVCFRVTDGEALLEVRDDGASELPLPGPQDGKFGLRLVGLLAEEQLGGDFSLLREQGCTVARARFPLAAPTD